MTEREKLVEAMARASWDAIWQDKYDSLSFNNRQIAIYGASAALDALERELGLEIPSHKERETKT